MTGIVTCGFVSRRTIRRFLKISHKICFNCFESAVFHEQYPWENMKTALTFPEKTSILWHIPPQDDGQWRRSFAFFDMLEKNMAKNKAQKIPLWICGEDDGKHSPGKLIRQIRKQFPGIRQHCSIRIYLGKVL